ncbi:MAG: right-handed parallel beta-helix repeat-containing protein [Sedimentisphaeraceae bacterium JB056]
MLKKATLILLLIFSTSSFALDIMSVLKDGGEGFDPWNQQRWKEWYEGNKVVKPFEISESVTFAKRGENWQPDISKLESKALFVISPKQAIDIDGNGIVIDVRNPGSRDWTLKKAYMGGWLGRNLSLRKNYGFVFSIANKNNRPSGIRNFTIRGFEQAIRTSSRQKTKLVIEKCVFNRNKWGVYLSGQNTTVKNNQFIENAGGGMYCGSGNHDNIIRGNTYRDNGYVKEVSYADIVFDTAYNMVVEDNLFINSEIEQQHFSAAVSMYRNMGENGRLREDAPHNNTIRNNKICGREVGIQIGARMGKKTKNDVSLEGRDYAFDNIILNNSFKNVTVGIKLNTGFNTVSSNIFEDVKEPIVLHCVFYNLIQNTISNQKANDIRLWLTEKDYEKYKWIFPDQSDLSNAIDKSEKLVQINADGLDGNIGYEGEAKVIISNRKEPFNISNLVKDKAIQKVEGDFYENLAGNEIAFIWDKPISEINTFGPFSHKFYTITIYDQRGMEINRCGRSKDKWKFIAAGNFLPDKGDEIAAVSEKADGNGNYTVKIFRRGYAEPAIIMLKNNSRQITSINTNSFSGSNEKFDEIAVNFTEGQPLCIKPSDLSKQTE